MSFLVRPPQLLRRYYKTSLWRMETEEPLIYLTFDDGPIEGLTPWVLDTLKHYGIKATFFCVGENIERNRSVFQRVLDEGHQVGNHTYNHVKGWKFDTDAYLENVEKCEILLNTKLFRPPYGRIKRSQFLKLASTYRVVFWDVLSYDYDKFVSPEACLENSIRYTRPGSIIVFHDNVKAQKNLKFALPRYIEHFLELNYKFAVL